MLKTVLFDLDDTIFDHKYCRRCGLNALQLKYPMLNDVSLDELEKMHEKLLQENYHKILNRSMTSMEGVIERTHALCLRHGLTLNSEESIEAAEHYQSIYEKGQKAVEGSKELISELVRQKVKIGIVTNGLYVRQKEKLKLCGVEDLVSFMVTSEDIGYRKPDPMIFETALKIAGALPSETVFIGDSWTSDIIGATQSGIKAVWLNRYGLKCIDAAIAQEINSLLPTKNILDILFTIVKYEGSNDKGLPSVVTLSK